MAVREVWASIDGEGVAAIAREGDRWLFPLPLGIEGHIAVEVWAEDYAGNQSYRAAVLYIEAGSVKEIRWLDSGCDCTMLRLDRPACDMAGRPLCGMTLPPRPAMTASDRPLCTMLEHEIRRTDDAEMLCGREL